jgi:two-component system invasion response regulator UvrY
MEKIGRALIKIALAEDHVMFREALCREIDTWENCQVILQASNGKALLDGLNPSILPDLVLVDLRMPIMNGYETIAALKQNFPEIRILVLSMYTSEEAAYRIMNLGANGFINKLEGVNKIRTTIEETICPAPLRIHTAISIHYERRQALRNKLSPEELQFLRCICSEKTYKAIAAEMGISGRHVEYLRYTLFERFKVQSRTGLAITAIEKGLAI